MKKVCLNCESEGRFRVPRELVEAQLGWKLDLPPDGLRVWIQYKKGDVYICKACLLAIVKLQSLTQQ